MVSAYLVPMGKGILIEELKKLEHVVDWDNVYGRWGTEDLIYADYYNHSVPPEHLCGKVTHVWLYFEK